MYKCFGEYFVLKRYIRIVSIFLSVVIFCNIFRLNMVFADGIDDSISSKAAVLMEAETGTVIYEKNADEALVPASITKIMTLLLIFEAIKTGKLAYEDTISTSEYAASMGGSQVFLEEGETQTVDTMIKCIAVASANDACVAMAEAISGSEEAFVSEMNKKAKALGMNNTNFVNCNGLDTDNHYTSAKDVAIMSRELITKYPEVFNYTQIWMDTIIHKTAKGESEFGLSNTNKLIKQYEYATGLKTGSTSLAKYCVSATACKDNVNLIAVIMAAPDYKVRFSEAKALLNYGFGVCKMYHDEEMPELKDVNIKMGSEEICPLMYEEEFYYMDMKGIDMTKIEKELVLKDEHKAPVEAGQIAGELIYSINGEKLGSVAVLYSESVKRAGFLDCIEKTFSEFAAVNK